MKKIDMSERAVMRRLRQIDGLHEACLEFMRAGKKHFAINELDSIEKRQAMRRYRKYLV